MVGRRHSPISKAAHMFFEYKLRGTGSYFEGGLEGVWKAFS